MSNEVHYLTAEGAERLKNELAYLKGPAREALAQRLRAAIQQGDLSENADYISAKERKEAQREDLKILFFPLRTFAYLCGFIFFLIQEGNQ